MFRTKPVLNIATHILWSVTFDVYDIMCKKYCRTEEVTDNNVANVHCMLDNKGYKPKLRIMS